MLASVGSSNPTSYSDWNITNFWFWKDGKTKNRLKREERSNTYLTSTADESHSAVCNLLCYSFFLDSVTDCKHESGRCCSFLLFLNFWFWDAHGYTSITLISGWWYRMPGRSLSIPGLLLLGNFLSKKNFHDKTGNWTWDIMIIIVELWPLINKTDEVSELQLFLCIILHYNVYYFHFTLQELC